MIRVPSWDSVRFTEGTSDWIFSVSTLQGFVCAMKTEGVISTFPTYSLQSIIFTSNVASRAPIKQNESLFRTNFIQIPIPDNIYLSWKNRSLCIPPIISIAIQLNGRIVYCIDCMGQWMLKNCLKLNASKTEVIWLGSPRRLAACPFESIVVHTE